MYNLLKENGERTFATVETKFLTKEAKEFGLHSADEGSAGLDLRILGIHKGGTQDLYVIPAHSQLLVSTGVAIYLKSPNLVGKVYVRSSIGIKKGLSLANGTGIIDSSYQGEILVCLRNNTDKDVILQHGERVAQYIAVPCYLLNLNVVEEFSEESTRGSNGIGSSGQVEFKEETQAKEGMVTGLSFKPKHMLIDTLEARTVNNVHYPEKLIRQAYERFINDVAVPFGEFYSPEGITNIEMSLLERSERMSTLNIKNAAVRYDNFEFKDGSLYADVTPLNIKAAEILSGKPEFIFRDISFGYKSANPETKLVSTVTDVMIYTIDLKI